jgi:arylsulfatase A-like enzyme
VGFLALAALATFLTTACSSDTTNKPPNIVFVLADDLDDALAQRMPAITSELGAKGASFDNAFNSYSICCPSRTTILTGLYAHNHHVESNNATHHGGWSQVQKEGLEQNTIATTLQNAGYRTGLFGKYLNGYDGTTLPPGWDEWAAMEAEHVKYYDYDLDENGSSVHYGNNTEDYLTDVLTGKVTQFINDAATQGKPFFAYVGAPAPHTPSTPPERYKGTASGEQAPRPPSFNEEDVSDKPSWIQNTKINSLSSNNEDEGEGNDNSSIDEEYRRNIESMLALDDSVASILEKLESTGQLDNTYVFFASDNGDVRGEHRVRGMIFPYEESVKTPLFVRGPGITPGSTIDELVLNTDYAETWADLAGTTFIGDGRSLVPLLKGNSPSWRSGILLESFMNKPKKSPNPPPFSGIRTKTHKYIEYSGGETELYDLSSDPYEMENISHTADSALVSDLKSNLDALRSCAKQTCQEAEDTPLERS